MVDGRCVTTDGVDTASTQADISTHGGFQTEHAVFGRHGDFDHRAVRIADCDAIDLQGLASGARQGSRGLDKGGGWGGGGADKYFCIWRGECIAIADLNAQPQATRSGLEAQGCQCSIDFGSRANQGHHAFVVDAAGHTSNVGHAQCEVVRCEGDGEIATVFVCYREASECRGLTRHDASGP